MDIFKITSIRNRHCTNKKQLMIHKYNSEKQRRLSGKTCAKCFLIQQYTHFLVTCCASHRCCVYLLHQSRGSSANALSKLLKKIRNTFLECVNRRKINYQSKYCLEIKANMCCWPMNNFSRGLTQLFVSRSQRRDAQTQQRCQLNRCQHYTLLVTEVH